MAADRFFSDTYAEARNRFLAAAKAARARLAAYRHPNALGPDGVALYMDTAWFGPADAKTVLLNISGTHGAEGFAGSAAQLAWITDGGPQRLAPGIAVLMVHAVNPFGFAWGLRGTETNVDLNRNFLDHGAPYPENPLYADIHPLLCPARLDAAALDRITAESGRLIAAHGQWALEDAISRGQYSHPDGYHFGGHGPAWSNLTLRRIVERDLAGARRVGFIDWHSGPPGDGELIYLCFSERGSPAFARAESWWGARQLDPAMVDRQWGSGRPTRRGILFWGLEEILTPRAEFAGAIIEFCSSRPKPDTAQALRASILERWLRFEGGFDAPEAAGYFEEIRDDYAPRRRSWQAAVIDHALETYERTLAGLGEWARD